MAAMNIIVAHDNPFNREVCLEDALYFHDCESLAHCIDLAESDKASFADSKKRILKRVGEVYSWERIADEYDRLFRATVAGNSAQSVDEEPVRGTSPNSPPHRYWGRKR
jgi:rhamnosyltransferase